jgi:hypothetical protein
MTQGQGLTRSSQLGREGDAKEDHRYRPHAIPQDRQPQVQQRIPHWRARRRQGPCSRKEGLSESSLGTRCTGAMMANETGA